MVPLTPELLDALEEKIDRLVLQYEGLKADNQRLRDDNERLLRERGEVRTRIDHLLERIGEM